MAGYGAHADTEVLAKAAGTASMVSDQIVGHKAGLRSDVDSLPGQWEGTARPAFEAAHAKWEQGVDRLVGELKALGENVNFSANTYGQADADSHRAFNGLMDERRA